MLKDLPEDAYLYYSMQDRTKEWFLKERLKDIVPWLFVGYAKYVADENFPELADDPYKYLAAFCNPEFFNEKTYVEFMNFDHTYKVNFSKDQITTLFGDDMGASLEEDFTLRFVRD